MTSASTTTAIPPAHKIRRLYLKGASVEVPHMDRMPRTPVQPVIGIDVQTTAQEGWPGTIECILRMTLQARVGDLVAFVIEVTEAGVFELPGTFSQEDLTRFVRKSAPAILFPMARRDLAALAVAGGFQPVLLDHIDFDALITEAVKRDWARLTPAPVSIAADVMTAAHAARLQVTSPGTAARVLRIDAVAQEAQAPAAPLVDERPDTQAVTEVPRPSWMDTQPVRLEKQPEARRSSAGWIAAGVLGLLVGGGWWWQSNETPLPATQDRAGMAQPGATVPAVVPVIVASKPASAMVALRVTEPSASTRKALEDSRDRLAALPAGWRSIELGQMEADADLRVLDALPLQAPLYLVRLPGGQLQILYGAFPSDETASAALEESRAWKAQGLRGGARIVIPGRAS